jgi:hypothetical protein
MPRPLPPYPPDEPYAATLAPLLEQLDQADCFANLNDAARWTLPLIQELNALALNLVHAGIAQLYIFRTLTVPNMADHWAILNATRAFGAVNSSALTLPCLRTLLRQAANLHLAVQTERVRDRVALANLVAIYKTTARVDCFGATANYLVFLDRAADQLTPLLRS